MNRTAPATDRRSGVSITLLTSPTSPRPFRTFSGGTNRRRCSRDHGGHYRGSFGNKAMWILIVITPPVVAAGITGIFSKRCAKTVLPAAAIIYGLTQRSNSWPSLRSLGSTQLTQLVLWPIDRRWKMPFIVPYRDDQDQGNEVEMRVTSVPG